MDLTESACLAETGVVFICGYLCLCLGRRALNIDIIIPLICDSLSVLSRDYHAILSGNRKARCLNSDLLSSKAELHINPATETITRFHISNYSDSERLYSVLDSV